MNAVRTAPSDTKPRNSSRKNTRLWNLPAYGKPLGSAPFHRPWKTPPIRRPRFPQLPQPLLLEEKKPESDEEPDSSSSTNSHIVWYENRGHVSCKSSFYSFFHPVLRWLWKHLRRLRTVASCRRSSVIT